MHRRDLTCPTFQPVRLDSTHDAATQVATRLRRIGGADAIGVRVHQDGETVRLTGHVPRWHLKQLATATVHSVIGDVVIENELTVAG